MKKNINNGEIMVSTILDIELTGNDANIENRQNWHKVKCVLEVIHNLPGFVILDVGGPSLLRTQLMRSDYAVFYTEGNLDRVFDFNKQLYDIILMSHVVEHLMNPLWAVYRLRQYLKDDGRFVIALPQRPRFLWGNHHFHEIDDRRIRKLFRCAGLEVVEHITYRPKREWWKYIGFRAFLRLFLERSSIYVLKK